MAKHKKNTEKEFKLSSWAINNKTTIYMAMVLVIIFRIKRIQYNAA